MGGVAEEKIQDDRGSRLTHFLRSASFVFLLSIGFALPSFAHAATLYLSPASGTYGVGKAFSVSVFVSSADQAINAVSGVVSFPKDKLEITGLSKGGSILSLWVQEPSFSNGAGTANFEGIVLNPGFTGAAGKIVTINFKTKAAGAATVSLSSGSALANDGEGTNVLKSLGRAQFTIGDAAPTPTPEPTPKPPPAPEVRGVPAGPVISSSTHPDSDKWYAEKDVKFTWKLPADVTSVRLNVDKESTGAPTVTYTPPIREKEVADLADGAWYFHAQFRNAAGWGKVAHFRVQIDTEKPSSFTITQVPREDLAGPKLQFDFDAKDAPSGIDRYEVSVDDKESIVWRDDGSHRFSMDAPAVGKHTLTVKAIDKAGNALTRTAAFTTVGIEPPGITEYPKKLRSGEYLTVRGLTYSNSKVTVWLQREGEEAKSSVVESNSNGRFAFVTEDALVEGQYTLWAEVVDSHGVQSLPSEKITIPVLKPAVLRIGAWLASFLALAIPLIALIILLLLVLWYGRHTFASLRERMRRSRGVDSALPKALGVLQKDIRKEIMMLKTTCTKRHLTREEERILRLFKADLSEATKATRKIGTKAVRSVRSVRTVKRK